MEKLVKNGDTLTKTKWLLNVRWTKINRPQPSIAGFCFPSPRCPHLCASQHMPWNNIWTSVFKIEDSVMWQKMVFSVPYSVHSRKVNTFSFLLGEHPQKILDTQNWYSKSHLMIVSSCQKAVWEPGQALVACWCSSDFHNRLCLDTGVKKDSCSPCAKYNRTSLWKVSLCPVSKGVSITSVILEWRRTSKKNMKAILEYKCHK